MFYDDRRRVCVLVGRNTQTKTLETWDYDGRGWKLSTTTGPYNARNAGIAFDSSRGVAVLYGGTDPLGTNSAMSDTWLLTPTDLQPHTQDTRPGTRLTWNLDRPQDATTIYLLGLALGSEGGIQVGTAITGAPILWPLANDSLFRLSLQIPTLHGVLDASGRGTPWVDIPRDQSLVGAYLSASALIWHPASGLRGVTRDVRAFIVP
jgi:hypothetical protein